MIIEKTKETVKLTREETAILKSAKHLLYDIYQRTENDALENDSFNVMEKLDTFLYADNDSYEVIADEPPTGKSIQVSLFF